MWKGEVRGLAKGFLATTSALVGKKTFLGFKLALLSAEDGSHREPAYDEMEGCHPSCESLISRLAPIRKFLCSPSPCSPRRGKESDENSADANISEKPSLKLGI